MYLCDKNNVFKYGHDCIYYSVLFETPDRHLQKLKGTFVDPCSLRSSAFLFGVRLETNPFQYRGGSLFESHFISTFIASSILDFKSISLGAMLAVDQLITTSNVSPPSTLLELESVSSLLARFTERRSLVSSEWDAT